VSKIQLNAVEFNTIEIHEEASIHFRKLFGFYFEGNVIFLFLDKQGNIVAKIVGAMTDDEMESYIKMLIDNK
jgi:hypothetical protein